MSYSEKEIREAGNFRLHITSYICRLASIHPKVCCCMDPRGHYIPLHIVLDLNRGV